jgi:DNA-directed RNA polymerase subunit E'/Rpb7
MATAIASESNCYSDCMATRKITIPYNEVTKHAAAGKVTEMIRKHISSQIENKCTIEGFVHPNTCKVLSHSSGMLQGPNVVFDVAYKCSVFLPCEGAVLVCRVRSVTGAGILAGINNASVVNPVVVYVLREHHSSESSTSYFNAVKPDSVIRDLN